MKGVIVRGFLLTMELMTLAACSQNPATAPEKNTRAGFSSADAASIGTSVLSMVELSDMYVSPEIYDLKVTVEEIVRGEKCGAHLKNLGALNKQLADDSEYLLARVRFEYKARGAPGNKTWELSGTQFNAYSADSKPYENPFIVMPQSGLIPSLRSGDVAECWLALLVGKNDRKPIMTFTPGGVWFRLY